MGAGAEEFEGHGEDGDEDDGEDDEFEMFLDEGLGAEEGAGGDANGDPGEPPYYREEEEGGVGHLTYAGDEGGEGADDGDEAGEDDGFWAVGFVEGVGAGEVFFVEEAGVFAAEDGGAEAAA